MKKDTAEGISKQAETWQSWVDYSIAYFNHLTMFKALEKLHCIHAGYMHEYLMQTCVNSAFYKGFALKHFKAAM